MPFETSLKIAVDTRGAKSSVKSLDTGLKKLSKTATRSFAKMKAAAGSVVGSIFSLKGAIAGLATGAGIKAITDSTLAFDRMDRALQVATGSAAAAEKEMAFLRATANELGLDITTAGASFAKLAAGAKGTVLAGQGVRDIFMATSQAATALGLTADQTGRALTAFEQIISKGTVSSEELKGQLGEALPGAFQLAAKSMGVTTSELNKMLAKGEVLAEDLLPKMAAAMSEQFGPAAVKASGDAQASFNRLNTAWAEMLNTIGKSGFVDLLAELATNVASWVNTVSANWWIFRKVVTQGWEVIGTAMKAQMSILAETEAQWSQSIDAMVTDWERFTASVMDSEVGAVMDFVGRKAAQAGEGVSSAFNSSVSSLKKFVNVLSSGRQSVTEFEKAQKKLIPKQFQKTTDKPLLKRVQALKAESSQTKELLEVQKAAVGVTMKQFVANEDVAKSIGVKTEATLKSNAATKEAVETNKKVQDSGKSMWDALGEGALTYARDAGDAFKNMKNASENVFRSLEDEIASFIKTGKFSFKSFADSVVNEMIRMASKAAASGIASLLGGVIKGAASSFGESIGASFFSKGGVVPHARGNVVKTPQVFPMANGKVGLRGESGPEAVVPLTRTASGDLGVASVGGGGGSMVVNIIDQRTGNEGTIETKERQGAGGTREMDIFIAERVSAILGNGSVDKQFNDNFGVKRAGIRMGK